MAIRNKVTVQMENGQSREFESNLTVPEIRMNNRIGGQHFYYLWQECGKIAEPMVGIIKSVNIEPVRVELLF